MATVQHEHEAVAKARQRLQRSTQGDRHPEYASSLNQLALLLIMHGDPDEAEDLLRQALEIRKEALGEAHPDYATSLSSLAGVLWARGDLDAAEPLLRLALDIRMDVLGCEHPKTGASLCSLEQLLHMKDDQGEFEHGSGMTIAPAATEVFVPPVDATAAGGNGASFRPDAPGPEPEPETARDVVEPSVDHWESLDLDGLRGRLDALSGEWADLGDALTRAAEAMDTQGLPAPETLEDDLRCARVRFAGLRADVARAAEVLGFDATQVDAAEDRDVLASFLSELAEARESTSRGAETQRQALAVLDGVLALRHVAQAEFPPLDECQARARRRRESIASARPGALPDGAAALAEGTDPAAALVALATGHDGLSDDRWTELMGAVRCEFGKSLAVAVGRARIAMT